MTEILTWGLRGERTGTLAEYITDCYPAYAVRGLLSWEQILQALKTDSSLQSLPQAVGTLTVQPCNCPHDTKVHLSTALSHALLHSG